MVRDIFTNLCFQEKQKKDEEINEILSKYHEVTEGVSFPDLFPSLRIRKGS